MSDYKRLTKKSWHDCKFAQLNPREVLYKLWQLENKIENGTLVELPCKVGDAIFFVYDYGSVLGECIDCDTGIVSAVNFQADGIWIYARYESGLSLWHKTTDIGTKIFLTEAEAEAKLEELKRGQK